MEPVDEKEMPEHLQISVDVLADRDPCVPEHLRAGHWASSSASLARWLPGEPPVIISSSSSQKYFIFPRLVEIKLFSCRDITAIGRDV